MFESANKSFLLRFDNDNNYYLYYFYYYVIIRTYLYLKYVTCIILSSCT